MDYQNPIVCTNYEEINALIPMITGWYQDGTFVHFIKQEHMYENCNLMQDSLDPAIKLIFISADLEQAARIIINQYNEHFPPREDDEDDNDEDDNDEEVDDNDDDIDNEVYPQVAFTCSACGVSTLGN